MGREDTVAGDSQCTGRRVGEATSYQHPFDCPLKLTGFGPVIIFSTVNASVNQVGNLKLVCGPYMQSGVQLASGSDMTYHYQIKLIRVK